MKTTGVNGPGLRAEVSHAPDATALPGPANGVARATGARSRTAAFSLIEIIVTVSLLTIIVLGLVYMFGQTQRAFTSSMAQVDVLESGRAVTEMLARELAEITPSNDDTNVNFVTYVDADSFSKPLLQDLPVSDHQRTNIVQRFYFLSRQNQKWVGRGYFVLPPEENAGMGTLFRFETNRPPKEAYNDFQRALRNGWVTNRVADGIVHLRLLPYDTAGRLITTTNLFLGSHSFNVDLARNAFIPDQTDMIFRSNAVPASIELELGILESQAMDRFRALGPSGADVQRTYLSNRAAQVHIFRQRIPIRNVDPSVYTNSLSK